MRLLGMLVLVWVVPASASAHADPCRGVVCSGHGECIAERFVPTCLCEEGYAADGIRCIRSAPSTRVRSEALAGPRIVHFAVSEGGRSVQEVGLGAGEPLSRYLAPHELWCSDFVSWVYHAAGVPFTGGYEGGWLLKNNVAIERWYMRNQRWVARTSDEWSGFTPQPGDYLRFRTSRYGHSGIVRFVAGETLYTVEGNVGGRVRLREYPRFRQHLRIEGFGLTTQSQPRLRELARLVSARTIESSLVPALPPRRARHLFGVR